MKNHFYNVISKSTWGRNTSLGQRLVYSYQYKAACSLTDHDYVQQKHLFDASITNIETTSHSTEKKSTLRTKMMKKLTV